MTGQIRLAVLALSDSDGRRHLSRHFRKPHVRPCSGEHSPPANFPSSCECVSFAHKTGISTLSTVCVYTCGPLLPSRSLARRPGFSRACTVVHFVHRPTELSLREGLSRTRLAERVPCRSQREERDGVGVQSQTLTLKDFRRCAADTELGTTEASRGSPLSPPRLARPW